MFSHLIFDIDGTLMDSLPFVTKAYLEACSAMGLEPNREAFLVHAGIRTALVFREYYRLNEEEFQKASAIYGAAFHRDSHTARPFPGIPELLSRLKEAGVQMCVATARTQDALDALFGSRGIWDYFSYFGCSTSRQERPNKADSIRRCAQHMGVPPEQCLMIGDR